MAARFNQLLVIAALFIIVAANAVTPAESVTQTFQTTYHVPFKQGFVLTGDVAALGDWNVTASPQLTWASGDVWSVTVNLTADAAIEFKLVQVYYDTKTCICWDESNNREWTVPTDSVTYYYNSFVCDTDSCGTSQDNAIKEDLVIEEVIRT